MKQLQGWASAPILIAAMCATMCATLPGHARVAIGALAGTVLDAQAKPVADATVTMQTSFGTRPHATHTDANGRFEFARFQTGQYDLRAYSNGMFSDWDKRIAIHAGKTTEVTLRIPAGGK